MARILIIDDEIDFRELLKERLEFVGHETEEAEDGLIGLEKVASYKPDVILLDLIMPNMDGYEVLKALQADEGTRQIPAIVLTGQDDFEAISTALQLGASNYLDKPCSSEDLLNAVQTATMGPAVQVPPSPAANYHLVG